MVIQHIYWMNCRPVIKRDGINFDIENATMHEIYSLTFIQFFNFRHEFSILYAEYNFVHDWEIDSPPEKLVHK